MIRHLTPSEFRAELAARPALPASALQTAAEIIAAVRARGDAALIEYIDKFEHRSVCHPSDLWIEPEWFAAAASRLPAELRDALELAARNIEQFQRAILEPTEIQVRRDGVVISQRSVPVARAGVYAPGGRAVLFSTILMTALPAKVAGVKEIILAMPPDAEGRLPDIVLAAAARAGVTRILACGGAHAIAALALGTGSIERVDKLAGPGNVFVTAAKKLLAGEVDIDGLAGPSEVLVLADEAGDAILIAADLIAQAEHDPDARAILVTTDAALAVAVQAGLKQQCDALPRREIISRSLSSSGAIVVTGSVDEAVALANLAAPEHLSLCMKDAAALLPQLTTAGAIFIGSLATEALGDYVAGPSHVLPTGGTGRFASGLSANFFRRRFSVLDYCEAGLRVDGPAAIALAQAEGLDGHAESIAIRLRSNNP